MGMGLGEFFLGGCGKGGVLDFLDGDGIFGGAPILLGIQCAWVT
jgi:hypothetical protein